MATIIKWDFVDTLLIAGCTGVEVAATIGVHPDTLYDRCKLDKQTDFSHYRSEKRAIGDQLLKKKQFDKAMGYCQDGDNTQLIWLGKTRLGQKEESLHTNTNYNLSVHHDLAAGSDIPTKAVSDSSSEGTE